MSLALSESEPISCRQLRSSRFCWSYVEVPEVLDENRSAETRAERGKAKFWRRDDMIIVQGNRGTSGGLGRRHKMIGSLFSNLVWRRSGPNQIGKKRDWLWVGFTRGGGLGGLAPGYQQAAPSGAPEAT